MRRFGLIGKSVAHSFSASYFANKFQQEGITDARYDLFPLEEITQLPALLASHTDLIGLNVTIPYKESVIPLLDALSDEARIIGAVNCIRITNSGTTGYNTDASGFRQSILPFLENQYERALLLGTGGASRAITHVLRERGIEAWYASTSRRGEHILDYNQLDEAAMKHFPLLVNCTPLGTYPRVDEKPPLPYGGLTPQHMLYDLVYNPPETAFLREGRLRGARTMNGLRMLEIQAEESWRIWSQSGDHDVARKR